VERSERSAAWWMDPALCIRQEAERQRGYSAGCYVAQPTKRPAAFCWILRGWPRGLLHGCGCFLAALAAGAWPPAGAAGAAGAEEEVMVVMQRGSIYAKAQSRSCDFLPARQV